MFGEHLATCICCGKRWTVGDCIPTVCPDCASSGHTGLGCRKCMDERMSRFEVSQLTHKELERQRRMALREGDTCPQCKDQKLLDMGNGTSGLRCLGCGFATAGGQG